MIASPEISAAAPLAVARTSPAIRLCRITKTFGATKAVDRVDLDLFAGEVHGLIGENGAGKSTLMRVLAGAYADYGGTISIGGRPAHIASPAQALSHGIVLVHQELSLLPELTIAENIFLGREPSGRVPIFINRRAIENLARKELESCGVDLDPGTKVERLGIAERQLVEIVKGVSASPRVLILDEPTSSLTIRETRELFPIVRRLAARGTAIVYISHKFDEIFAVTKRVTVLRDGALVATAPTVDWTEASLVRTMVGRDLSALFPRTPHTIAQVRLEVRGLARRGVFGPISFVIRQREIVGLYGMVGAGRTAVAEALFGLAPADSGIVLVDGQEALLSSSRRALAAGISMAPEDRHQRGIVPMLSVRENMTLSALAQMSRAGFVRHRAEVDAVRRFLMALRVRAASQTQPASSLSGGNQQKIVLGRSIMPNPKVLVFDEPTRGIDVVSKSEVHASIDNLSKQGMAILLISSELPEILGMCDRILVMREGLLVGAVDREVATEESLVAMAAGASHGD